VVQSRVPDHADQAAARQVVVATGPFQVPFTAPAAQRLDDSVTQLHSAGYRNPQRVVETGKVITAAGVSAGIDMALPLLARLHGPELAECVQLAIEYDPQPPFDTVHRRRHRPRSCNSCGRG